MLSIKNLNRPRCLFVCLALISTFALRAFAEGAQSAARTREFELTYKGEIQLPPQVRSEVWIPLASSREGQTILERKINLPLSFQIFTEPTYKNEILYFKTDGKELLVPFSVQYHVVTDLNFFKTPLSQRETALYLRPSRLMTVDRRVRKIAAAVVPEKASLIDKAKAIYEYVIGHMTYDKNTPGWGKGDTERACVVGKGNCTDFHSLFISVAHAAEIPARFKIGFQVPTDPEGPIPGYHCWAEFSDEQSLWNPVDASEAWKHPEKRDVYFAHFDPNKFLMSIGRDITLKPKQKGDPVNIFFYPYLEADGKVLENVVNTEFYYRSVK